MDADLADNYLLTFGGFAETDINQIKKNENNFDDLHKVIKINDYKTHNMINKNCDECSICLEEFEQKETTCSDIKKYLEIYKFKKYLNEIGQEYLKEIIDLDNDNDNLNNTIVISCYHIFHKKCLLEWYKKNKSCPLCRIDLKKIK